MNGDQHPTPFAPDCVARVESEIRRSLASLNLPSDKTEPILLAVSGGPDSLCMADAFITLQEELRVAPAIAHLNHGLRGDAAQADADFVRRFAEERHISFTL